MDVIIALNETNNYTAKGELYIDDSSKKGKLNFFESKNYSINLFLFLNQSDTHLKNNYHRLIYFKAYRQNDQVNTLI